MGIYVFFLKMKIKISKIEMFSQSVIHSFKWIVQMVDSFRNKASDVLS